MSFTQLNKRQLELLNNSQFYEFQQSIKAVVFRTKAKKEYSKAINLCFEASICLCQKGIYEEMQGLCDLIIETYKEAQDQIQESEFLHLCTKLFEQIPTNYKFTFANQALHLIKTNPQNLECVQNLHHQIAIQYMNLSNYGLAHLHFLITNDVKNQVESLRLQIEKGFESEQPLFIVRSLLMLISNQQFQNAEILLKELRNTKYGQLIVESPEIHFCEMVLDAGQRNIKEKKIGEVLKERYSRFFERDPKLAQLVEAVLQVVFGFEKVSASFFDIFFKDTS